MTEDTKAVHQLFIDRQRKSAVDFLEKALIMVEYGVCLGNDFTSWELKIINELIQFTRIPENCSRNELAEELEFQLECMARRGESNPKVTAGENSLFKMVNNIRLIGDLS